jgi:hypothetical protein
MSIYGKEVRVHYNLHTCRPLKPGDKPKPGEICWVAKTKQAAGWRVEERFKSMLLKDCTFEVSLSGVARINRTRNREVIAWISGTAVNPDSAEARKASGTFDDWEGVSFNPFKADHFYREGNIGSVVEAAQLVYVSGRRCVAKLRTRNPRSGPGVAGSDQLELLAEHLGGNVDY